MSNSNFSDDGQVSPWKRVIDYIFGYDYFISYAWSDGRKYAENLQKSLQSQRLKCFLDSEEFAKGVNWLSEARRALRKTTRLVLVGSPAAIQSEAVENEVEIFHGLDRHIIPISFDGSMDYANIAHTKIGQVLGPEIIRTNEKINELSSGPSDEVVKSLTTSFTILTQDQKRARIFASVAILFVFIALVAFFFWNLADTRLTVANTRLNNSLSLALSRASDDQQKSFQQDELSALLAVQAWKFANRGDGSTLPQSDAALRSISSKHFFGQRLFFPYRKDRDIEGLSFVPNSGDIVVTGEYTTWKFARKRGEFVSQKLLDGRLELVTSSREGKWIAGVTKQDGNDNSYSGRVILFKSLESNDQTSITAPPGKILSLRLLDENRVLAITDKGGLFELDRAAQRITEIEQIDKLRQASISPEGKKIAWIDKNSELFVGNSKQLGTDDIKIDIQAGDRIQEIFFSPKADFMGVRTSDTAYVIDLARPGAISKKISLYSDKGKRRIFSAAISSGLTLALGHDSGDISLFDLSNLEKDVRLLANINGNGDAVGHLEFTPDNKMLLSASSQSVHRWFLKAPWYAEQRVTESDCNLLVLHDQDKAAVVGRDKGSILKQVPLGQDDGSSVKVIGKISGFYTESMDVSQDGRWIAVGYTNNPVEVFDTVSLRSVKLQGVGGRDRFNELRFSSDGNWLYGASGYHGPVVRWSVHDFGKIPEQLIPANELDYLYAKFLDDDKTLVVWNNEKVVSVSLTEGSRPAEIYNVSQQLSAEYEINHVAAVSTTTRTVAIGVGRDQPGDRRSAVVVVPLDKSTAEAFVMRGFTGVPRILRFSDDGNELAAGFGYDDPKVLLWKMNGSDHGPYTIGKQKETVNDIRFLKGGFKQVVSCDRHGLSFWTVESGIFAEGLCQRVGRSGMLQEEWAEHVGNVIPYEISCK